MGEVEGFGVLRLRYASLRMTDFGWDGENSGKGNHMGIRVERGTLALLWGWSLGSLGGFFGC
jgi:hypothetical protein